jgi:hypothetical protein
MSRYYAETGLIRQASEQRISNRWNKHSSLTQSLHQLKRDIILIPLGRHAIPEGGVRESDADKAERNRDAGSFFLRKDEEEYITS